MKALCFLLVAFFLTPAMAGGQFVPDKVVQKKSATRTSGRKPASKKHFTMPHIVSYQRLMKASPAKRRAYLTKIADAIARFEVSKNRTMKKYADIDQVHEEYVSNDVSPWNRQFWGLMVALFPEAKADTGDCTGTTYKYSLGVTCARLKTSGDCNFNTESFRQIGGLSYCFPNHSATDQNFYEHLARAPQHDFAAYDKRTRQAEAAEAAKEAADVQAARDAITTQKAQAMRDQMKAAGKTRDDQQTQALTQQVKQGADKEAAARADAAIAKDNADRQAEAAAANQQKIKAQQDANADPKPSFDNYMKSQNKDIDTQTADSQEAVLYNSRHPVSADADCTGKVYGYSLGATCGRLTTAGDCKESEDGKQIGGLTYCILKGTVADKDQKFLKRDPNHDFAAYDKRTRMAEAAQTAKESADVKAAVAAADEKTRADAAARNQASVHQREEATKASANSDFNDVMAQNRRDSGLPKPNNEGDSTAKIDPSLSTSLSATRQQEASLGTPKHEADPVEKTEVAWADPEQAAAAEKTRKEAADAEEKPDGGPNQQVAKVNEPGTAPAAGLTPAAAKAKRQATETDEQVDAAACSPDTIAEGRKKFWSKDANQVGDNGKLENLCLVGGTPSEYKNPDTRKGGCKSQGLEYCKKNDKYKDLKNPTICAPIYCDAGGDPICEEKTQETVVACRKDAKNVDDKKVLKACNNDITKPENLKKLDDTVQGACKRAGSDELFCNECHRLRHDIETAENDLDTTAPRAPAAAPAPPAAVVH
jgi:hypothetical protein